MSNPFYYLAGLLLLSAYPLGKEPLAFAEHLVAPWAVVGGLLIYAGISWAVLARPPDRPPLARFLLRLLAMVLYAELIFIYHLPLWVWSLGVEDDPLASSLLTLAPLLALFAVLAVIQARTDPHGGGLRFAFRGFLGLSFLPLFLMLLLDELFERVHPLSRLAFVYPAVGWMLSLGGLALLMVFLPPLLRVILGRARWRRGRSGSASSASADGRDSRRATSWSCRRAPRGWPTPSWWAWERGGGTSSSPRPSSRG